MKPDSTSITGSRQSLGYFQWTPTGAASKLSAQITAAIQALITASGVAPGYAVIQNNVSSSSIRWRDDGTAPTAAIGMVLGVAELDFAGDIMNFQAIISTGSPVLDVTLYA
jgi:hypothetical protein